MDVVRCKSKEMRLNYNSQMERVHKSTRWYCPGTADSLGMHLDIQEAFGNVGALSFLSMNYPSYPVLTSEFLASFETNIGRPSDEGYIRFHLGNKRRTVNLERWNEIFGFHHPTQDYRTHNLGVRQTWGLLTGMGRLPTGALKGRDIASPLFRVILRILGNSIWARRENSRPMQREIGCVHGMLFVPEYTMNLGFEFLHHLLAYSGLDGEVWLGGMITRIAMHFDIDLTAYTSIPPTFIDRHYLLQANVIEVVNEVVHSRFVSGYAVPITPERMDLLHVPNWYAVWAGEPLPRYAAPDFDPTTDTHLRVRERRVYMAATPEIEHDGDDDVEMAPTPEIEYAPEYGWHGTAMASGSGTAPEYPAYYHDLCTRMDGMKTGIDDLRTGFDEQKRVADERWQRQQEFMTYVESRFDPPVPGPNGTPPHHY